MQPRTYSELDLELYQRVEAGDATGVQRVLDAKANPSMTIYPPFNMTLLFLIKNAEIAQKLIDAKADVSARNFTNDTALYNIENPDCIDVLIRAKADVSVKDDSDTTPLHYARNAVCAQKLLDAKADLEARGTTGFTPLHIKVMTGETGIVKQLIHAKANLEVKNCLGETLLDSADNNPEMIAELQNAYHIKRQVTILAGLHKRCGKKSVLTKISQSPLFDLTGVSMTIFSKLSFYRPKPKKINAKIPLEETPAPTQSNPLQKK